VLPHKGIKLLVEAAGNEIPVRVAGNYCKMAQLVKDSPKNVKFLGFLEQEKISTVYQKARFIVLPTLCFEACPLSVLEAMSYGLPVFATRIGALEEIVENRVTRLLFEKEDAQDLSEKMRLFFDNSDVCRKMVTAAREKAIREYSGEAFFRRYSEICDRAIEVNKAGNQSRGNLQQ
jgi:glycosyltransferase involved in cell wall biosynthesis